MTWRTARRYSKSGSSVPTGQPRQSAIAKQANTAIVPPRRSAIPTAPRSNIPHGTGAPRRTAIVPQQRVAIVDGVRRTAIPSDQPRPSHIPGPKIVSLYPAPTKPSVGFHPKSPDLVFHPPGPGIGLRKGPAPALGRPGLLPGNHGGWKNESCYSQGSKGWKPDILTLGDAHNCPGDKGPQSPPRPPNISQDPAGYNTKMFPGHQSVADILMYLGYRGEDGNALIRQFQRHWNLVISRIALVPDRYGEIPFAHVPQGNLRVDGEIGPNTLNALEVAMINQRLNEQLAWPEVIKMVITAGTGYGKERLYNAAQGM